MSLKIAGIEFDDVADDAPVDILYLNAGDPRAAVDWDESEGATGSATALTAASSV